MQDSERKKNDSNALLVVQSNKIEEDPNKFNIKRDIIETIPFTIFTTLLIIANTITLALDAYPIDKDTANNLDMSNLIFTAGFVLEMVLKIAGMGIREYVRDNFNNFDATIVILSLVELILTSSNFSTGKIFSALAAFRSVRLFRIFKLARNWESLRNLLTAMVTTISAISDFMILVVLFTLVAALVGMEFFAYNIRFMPDGTVSRELALGESPRTNFDTFGQAMLAVFGLFTNENWNGVAYDCMRGYESWVPIGYFIVVMVIGNFVLVKLFLAILIYHFGESKEAAEAENNSIENI